MTAADFPFELRDIERAARSVRFYGVDLDDVVAEAACLLISRARSRPEQARANPGAMMRWAAQDAVRRLTGSRRAGRPELVRLGAWELASPAPAQLFDEDDETDRQRAEWRALTTGQRLVRIAEADAALGSSPRVSVRPAAPGGRWGLTAERRAVLAARVVPPAAPRPCLGCPGEVAPEEPAQRRYCSAACRERARVRAPRRPGQRSAAASASAVGSTVRASRSSRCSEVRSRIGRGDGVQLRPPPSPIETGRYFEP
jgi:hypothetical protein